MDYEPFCGYWFYGASTNAARASYFCSWGLLVAAPIVGVVGLVVRLMLNMDHFNGGAK